MKLLLISLYICNIVAAFRRHPASIFKNAKSITMKTDGAGGSGGIDQPRLKVIDEKMNDLVEQMKSLKNAKRELLSGRRGIKFLNGTGNANDAWKLFRNFAEDDDNDEDEDDVTSSFFPFPPEFGNIRRIRIIRRDNGDENEGEFGGGVTPGATKSDNFEVIKNSNMNFSNIGGYTAIKKELMQCADLLLNYDKYAKFNVRVPKGLILEGPPGNGKTLLAKCFSGQINVSFIPVSGAQFQEKYVGVGASRIRELFKLAMENRPCIVFIDEIDALGRKRTDDESSHNAERDTTLNELLVSLDGFKNISGVFLLASTNRIDLLDSALTRPGRIDKSVFVGLPDEDTRTAIVKIHIQGKPYDRTVTEEQIVDMTRGCSGAQIENLLNEAMLYALRDNREQMSRDDLEFILTRVMVGWQTTENKFTPENLYQISVHEMGHAVVGALMAAYYRKLIKVSLNMWSPRTPGFTLFENEEDNKMNSKESLFSHLMVLLAGQIAEEVFFQDKTSTGAMHDLEQARNLAEEMILKYGMGSKIIYPYTSNKYREEIDREIDNLISIAHSKSRFLILNSRILIEECARTLVNDFVMTGEQINKRIHSKHAHLLNIVENNARINSQTAEW